MTTLALDDILREVEPRTLAGAGAALLVIGMLAGTLYGIKPAYLEYRDLASQHELALLRTPPNDPESMGAAIASLEKEVQTLRNQLYGGAAAVPRNQLESFVVGALDRLSERHGVRLMGITPATSSQVWLFEELPYSVEVEGSYFSIHRWLYDVEQELRPMVVKQFQLTRNRSGEGVLLDFRVVAYRASEGGAG